MTYLQYLKSSKVTEFKAFIVEPFAWPGGYVKHMVCADGACLCYKCAKDNADQITEATATGTDDQWRCIGVGINWEDADLYCAHCNAHIEPEYGDA